MHREFEGIATVTTPSVDDARKTTPVDLPTERRCPLDPPSELSELRDSHPIARFRYTDGHVGWLITSHELARDVLGDHRFSVLPGGQATDDPARKATLVWDAIQSEPSFPDAPRALVERYLRDGQVQDAFRDPAVVTALREQPPSKLNLFNMDAPQHTRMRRILAGHFTVRRAGEHRARIEQIVSDRMDAMEQLGAPVDFVETFALPIPSLMTCELFGSPEADRGKFEELTAMRFDPASTVEDVLAASENYRAYVRGLIEEKIAHPTDDLLSTLVQVEGLGIEELVSTVVLLISAAHQSTASTLAMSVLALLQDRSRWEALKAETIPVEGIVEELLRYTSVVQTADIRTALEDVTLGGTEIKAFETVVISLPAANRDPKVFDNPEQLDLTRRAAGHMTFGYGIHQCLGQHLARLELQIALTGLARRFPDLDLAIPFEDVPARSGNSNFYGVVRLPVTW